MIRDNSNQRLLTIFALDDITATYKELLSAPHVPREVNSCNVNCGYNDKSLKEGQAWSFIAVNNGYV